MRPPMVNAISTKPRAVPAMDRYLPISHSALTFLEDV